MLFIKSQYLIIRFHCLSSATWPPAVQKMADSYMKDPFKVFVGTLDLAVSFRLPPYIFIFAF